MHEDADDGDDYDCGGCCGGGLGDLVLQGTEGEHDEDDLKTFEQNALEGEREGIPVVDACALLASGGLGRG